MVIKGAEEGDQVQENIARMRTLLGMLDESQVIAAARLKLKLAQVVAGSSGSEADPGVLYREGVQAIGKLDCSSFNVSHVLTDFIHV